MATDPDFLSTSFHLSDQRKAMGAELGDGNVHFPSLMSIITCGRTGVWEGVWGNWMDQNNVPGCITGLHLQGLLDQPIGEGIEAG